MILDLFNSSEINQPPIGKAKLHQPQLVDFYYYC